MGNRIYLLALIFCVCLGINAQTLTGKILDEQRKPIDAVNIMLTDSMGRAYAFAFSSSNGTFKISAPLVKDTDRNRPTNICFSIIGYERKEIPLSQFRNEQTIILRQESFVLKEVVVRPNRIISKGDTLTYNVSAFKQGQDRSIADVLKKMPGIQVAPSGQISYQGKAINKFYIEGMDLMGNKYVQASENLPADKIMSVQVLENHQPITSLRGVQFSDQAAINLVLSDSAKNAWVGIMDAGIGVQLGQSNDILYDGRLMGMIFGRMQQNLSMYKCNNTGKDITREIRDVVSLSQNQLLRGLLANLSTAVPDLEGSRTRFNTSHSLTTNQLFKTKKGDNLRIQLDYLWSKNEMESFKETEYIDLGDMLFTESTSSHSINHRLKGDVNYKINNNDLYLNNQLHGYIDFDRSSGKTILNGSETSQKVHPQKRLLSDNFDIIKVLNNELILNFTSRNSYNYQPGQLLTLKGYDENLGYSNLETRNVLSFRHRLNRIILKYEMGMKAQSESLNIEYAQTKQKETSRRIDFFFTPSLNIKKNDVKLTAALKADWLVGYRFALLPSVRLEYGVSATTTLNANYSYSQSPSSLMTLFTTPVFISYRSAIAYSGQMEYNSTHTCKLSMNYKQPIKGNFLTLSAQMVKKNDAPLYYSSYRDSVYTRVSSSEHKPENSYMLSLYAAKSLFWCKTSIAFSAVQNWSDYYVMIVSDPCKYRMTTSRLSMQLSMSPARILSLELKSQLTSNKQKSCENDADDSKRLTWLQHAFKIFCFPTDNWEIGFTNELYNSNDNSVSNNYFADVHVSYRTKRYELKLMCNNIFNNKKYERRILTSNTRTYSTYSLRPREVLMSLSMDL